MAGISPSRGRWYLCMLMLLSAILSWESLAQGQLVYRGSLLDVRRTSPFTFDGTNVVYTARVSDDIGFQLQGGCAQTLLTYSSSGANSLITETVTSTCLPIANNLPDLSYGFRSTSYNISGSFTTSRQIPNAQTLSGSEPSSTSRLFLSGFNPRSLASNILNQPPVATMLPIVTLPAGCTTVLEIPIYDPDRFDTTRCELDPNFDCDGTCSSTISVVLGQTACQLTIQSSTFDVNTMVTVSLTIIDSNFNDIDMSSISLQFTIDFSAGLQTVGTTCQLVPLDVNSVISSTGVVTKLSVEGNYNNRLTFVGSVTSGILAVTPSRGQAGTQSDGTNTVDNPAYRLMVQYRENVAPVPLSVCFQLYDTIDNDVSGVTCHFFQQGRALFGRSAIAGNSGATISVLLSVEQFIRQTLTLLTERFSPGINIDVTSGRELSGQRQIETVDLLLPGSSTLEVGMLSIPEIEGPEVLIYIFPAGSTDYFITISSLELVQSGADQLLRVTACRCDDVDLDAIFYISSPLIDLTSNTLNRVPPFEPFFRIPGGMECADFIIPLLENMVNTANLTFVFDAEGPFRVDTPSLSFSSRCLSQPCGQGICNDLANQDLCDCTGTGFTGFDCSIPVMIQFQVESVTVMESEGIVTVDVCLDPQIGRSFPVTFSLFGPPAISSDIMLPSGGTIDAALRCTVGAQDVCTTVSLNIVNDNIPESTETHTITLISTTPSITADPAMNTFTVTIQDDDVVVSIGFTPTDYTVSSTAPTVPLTVCLIPQTPAPAAVSFVVIGSVQGTVEIGIISQGESCTTFDFPVANMDFQVTLFSATGSDINQDAALATVTLFDALNLNFNPDTYNVNEGVSFNLQICGSMRIATVNIIGLTFNFALSASPLDLVGALPTQIVIPASSLCGSVLVTTRTDGDPTDEIFTISMTSATSGNLGPDASVTIDVPPLVTSLSTTVLTVTEGNSVVAEVCNNRLVNVPNQVLLNVNLLAGQAVLADFVNDVTNGITETIPANTMCVDFIIPIALDNLLEGNEVFTLSIASTSVGTPSAAVATVTIMNADIGVPGTVNLQFVNVNVMEGSLFTFQVCLTVGSDGIIPPTISAAIQANPIPPTTANDFTPVPSPITFSPTVGNLCSPLNAFTAVPDNDLEGSETFTVSIVTVFPASLMIGQPVLLEILPDPLTLNLNFNPDTYNVNEGDSFNLQICGSTPIATVNIIGLMFNFAPPVSQLDLFQIGVLPTQIVIPANSLCGSVLVPTRADGDPTDEIFTISMMSATSGNLGPDASVTIAVPPLVTSLSMTVLTVTEGNSVVAEVCNNRLVNVPNEVLLSVNLLTGEAVLADFVNDVTNGITETIPANTMCVDFIIPIALDTLLEGNEVFTLSIASTSVGTPSAAVATVTIMNADIGAPGTLNLQFVNVNAMEGSLFTFQVCLTVGSDEIIPPTISAAIQANPIPPTTANDFTPVPSPITFSPTVGNLCSPLTAFTAVLDNDLEGSETLTVSIITVFPTNLMIGDPVLLEILPNLLTLDFNPDTYNVNEGDSFNLQICGSMTIPTPNTISLMFIPLSASQLDLVGALPTEIVIPANSLCGSVLVTTRADGDPTDETFTFSMTSATSGNLGPSAVVTIAVPPLVTTLSMTVLTVTEGSAVVVEVCNNRIVNVVNQVVLDFNFLTGVVQADFVTNIIGGIGVTIPANLMCGSVSILTANDGIEEGDEVFTISIASTTVGTPSAAISSVTIMDVNIAAVLLRLDPLVAQFPESDPVGQINLVAEEPLDEDIFVSIGVTPITATSMSDFSLVPFVATLPAGFTTLPINVLPEDDPFVELTEILEVFIVSATGNTRTVEAMSTSTVSILDNDNSVISIVKSTTNPVDELDGIVIFMICSELNLPTPIDITVDLQDGTAVEGQDFTPLMPPTVTILANQGDGACVSYSVALLDNPEQDLPVEDFTALITNVQLPGIVSTVPSEASVTCSIIDERACDPSTSGDMFVLTLTPPFDSDDNFLYFVSASIVDVDVTVSVAGIYANTFTVQQDDSFALLLPDSVAFPNNPLDTHTNVILVEATGPVNLYSQNRRQLGGTGDTTQIYPYRNLGNYYTVTVSPGPGIRSFVSIASRDDNLVAITFSTEYSFAGVWYQPYETAVVTLNALEAIFLSSTSDLSGTRIFSSAPLFVLDGVVCNNIPNGNFGWCDLTMEQLLPALGVGTLSVVGPIPGRDAYTVHFTGIQDNTQVTFMDETILLNAGQQVRRFVYNDWRVYEIISDQPIYINQYVSSFTVDFETGDPAKLVLPPVSDFGGTVSFFVPDFGGQSAITIYVCCLARMGLLMDGNPITNFDYYVAEGCKWCSVSLENIPTGRHVISHADQTETFYVAIFNQETFRQEGSAMSAGFNFGCGDSGCDCVALPTDPCFDQPCMNGGICRQKVGGDGYFCRCTGNYVGENCETVAGVCTVSNLYNYVNLDGEEYSISSNCRYTLFAIPNSQTVFNILIWYNDCDGDIVLVLCINYGPYTIYLRPGHIVEINNARAKFPIVLVDISITIVNGKLVVVIGNVRIVYYKNGYVLLQVSEQLAGLTDGLCGNFNGVQDELDAFINPFGPGASIAFANSFIDQSLTTCVQPDPLNPPVVSACLPDNVGAAQALCSIINDANGPLSPCFNTVSESPFFTNCVNDVCATVATDACMYIERYVTACRRANVFLKDWRAAASCELVCPFGQFEDCLNPCPATCYGFLTDTCECTEGSCFEGCQCPPGTFYSSSGCLRPEECGCVAQGLYFEIGEYYVDETCTQRCLCTGNNNVVCEKYACHPNAICSNNFQRPSCVCVDGYTGDGEVCILDTIKGIRTITPCYGQQCDGFCLSSPNYGFGDYNDWETILYVVGVPCASNLRVECNDISTESGKDFLHIGPGADVPDLVCVWRYDLLGVLSLTGDTTLFGWDSNDWLLWMYFNTDRTKSSRGFQCCFYADDPCRDDPCINGGICEKIPNFDFVCKCPRGYTGRLCEEPVYYCGSYGDPHYFTFDGLFYDFQGTCQYFLLRDLGLGNGPVIEITQSLERTDQAQQVTANELITISIPTFTIVLGQGGSVMVNGLATHLPYLPNNDLSIRKSGDFVVVRMTLTSAQGTADVEVLWNGKHFVEIAWPFTHRGLVNGLCGIPDGDISNDHQNLLGVNIADDNTFASSFRVDVNCLDNPAVLDPCDGGNDQFSPYANFFCGAAINTNVLGAFYQCSLMAPINEFFSSCLYDGCATLPNQEYICDTISAAEHVCNSLGIQVGTWRSSEICEPCCPPNSVFSECAPPNPPTCVDPNPVCDRLCTAACVCNDGFVWDNGQCIPLDQCGCFDLTSGNYYPRGAVFLNNICTILTTCLPDGSLFSEPAACAPNEVCSAVDGRPACVCIAGTVSIGGSSCQVNPCANNPCNSGECLTRLNPNTNQVEFAGCRCHRGFTGQLCTSQERICTAFGDPHYRTFDGVFFDFQGRCSYTLVQNGCTQNNQNTFSIIANNDLYAGGTTATMAVTIEHEGDTVVLHRFGVVSINDIFVDLPAASTGGLIYRVGEVVIMETLDFQVKWNGLYNVDIKISSLSSDICGLCGNNNGNILDDLRTPTGVLVDQTTFGNSWITNLGECAVLGNELPHPCGSVVDELTMSQLTALCSGIQEGTGQCGLTINPAPYFQACLYDACANPDDLSGPSSAYVAYLRECTGRQLLSPDWRFPEILDPSKMCPPNSYFAIDAPTCEPMCGALANQPTPCQNKRAPHCRCMDGFLREGDRCILPSECGCTDVQRYYPLGSQWLRAGCQEKCLCNLNAQGMAAIECVGNLCSGNAVCDSSNGVRACVCLPGFFGNGLSCLPTSCDPNPCQNGGTCQDMAFGNFRCVCPYGTFGELCEENGALCYIYGDPYFETFDGQAYNFQGVCEYSLVRACGTANIPFSITGTLENVANSPLSALRAVTISLTQPRALLFELTRDSVLLNGMAVNSLPYININDGVEIIYNGDELWFRTQYFNVRWDHYSKAVIEMRSSFRASGICGMCGNFDGFAGNDFTTLAGLQVTTPEELGNSFRVSPCSTAVATPTDPCATFANNQPLADLFCDIINDPFGPFVNCPPAIRNQAEVECRRDICLTGTTDKGCYIVDVLVDRCLNAIGGPPINWRLDSNFACPDRCPPGSSFSNCVPACTPSCLNSNLELLYECNYPCVPGCVCNRPDEIIQDGQCMPAGDCGCTDANGNYYPSGATYLIDSCTMECTCTVRGFPECVPFQCMLNAVCQTNPDLSESCTCAPTFILDGLDCVADPCSSRNCNGGECFNVEQVTFCVCPQGTSGESCELDLTSCFSYGDPHIDTFDGRPYDYNGACSYLLARAVVPVAGILQSFTIIEHNMRVLGQSASISTGVTVTFPSLPSAVFGPTISIDAAGTVTDQSGIVYNLPWQFHQDILVETDGISVIVKTTFGLKLLWFYGERVIQVSLTDAYANIMEGLCGDFNGNLVDDLNGPVGPLSETAFGNQWFQPAIPCDVSGIETDTPSVPPCPADVNDPLNAMSSTRCNNLLAVNFASCSIGAVTLASVLCRNDVCSKQGAARSECSAFTYAAQSCADAGFVIGNWRSGSCEITCPGISQYNTLADGCPMTCFKFLTNDESPCTKAPREGCQCPVGFLWSGNDCVLPENCGCVQNGVYFILGETYFTASCQQQCTCTTTGVICQAVQCSADGSCVTGANGRPTCVCNDGFEGDGINCDRGACPEGCGTGTCGQQNGRSSCICPDPFYGPTCALTRSACSFRGDPHYQTLDGRLYDFQGECSYTMMDFDFDPGMQVVTTNQPYRSTGAATTREIIVVFRPGTPLEETVMLLQGRVVMVDGNLIEPPFSRLNYEIVDTAGLVRIITDFGVEIEWNGIYDGVIYVDDMYINNNFMIRGLCGTFNNNQNDDFVNLFGVSLGSARDFGNFWQNREFGPICEPTEAVNPCDSNAVFQVRSAQICGIIIDPNGPLAECIAALGQEEATAIFNNCVFDVCFTLPDETDPSICGTITAYVQQCQRAGVTIGDWRASLIPPALCDPLCPTGSVFSSCTSLCPLTCADVTTVNTADPICTTPCQEGCECLPGRVWQGGICVPEDQCGCFDIITNQYYAPGRTFLRPGCQEQCICQPGGQLDCSAAVNCHCEAECDLIGDAYQCVCPPPFFGDGVICSVDPCILNDPCGGTATCQPTATGGTFCACPMPGQFGNNCEFMSGECWAVEGEIFVSYDGEITNFYGQCSYVLTATTNPNAANAFRVEITLSNDPNPIQFQDANQISSILVTAGTESVLVTRIGPPPSFTIDGQEFALIVKGNLDIVAWRTLDRVIVFLLRGVVISFTQTSVHVTVSSTYNGQLTGICGDSDGVANDGSVTFTEVTPCPEITVANPCDDLDASSSAIVASRCEEIILDPRFVGCPATLLSQCLAVGCANFPDPAAICAFVDIGSKVCGGTPPLITEFAHCVPDCGPFAEFSTDIVTCQRTCNDVFPLPSCPVTTMAGCQCQAGRILNNVGACVLPAQCGCLQLGVYYEPGQMFYTPNCDQLCTCQPGGFASCENTNGCPALSTCVSPMPSTFDCQCQAGFRLENNQCIPDPCVDQPCQNGGTCSRLSDTEFECCCLPGFDGILCDITLGVCKIYGNPFIETFDGNNYHFIGGGDSCEYQLATGSGCITDNNPTVVQNFVLTASFMRGASGTSSLLGSITLTIPGIQVIEVLTGGILLLDQVQVYPPVTLPSVLITGVYDNIIIRTNFGLNIVWREGYVFVYLDSAYTLKTCGLCGDFDGDPNDDNRNRVTGLIVNPNLFGDSYEMGSCGLSTPVTLNQNLCTGRPAATVNEAELYCNILQDPTGPFSECIVANPALAQSFYTSCRNDLCEFLPIRRSVCDMYQAFAHYCRNNGFPVRDWRATLNAAASSVICLPFTCPVGSTYTDRMISCPPTCTLDPTINRKRECLTVYLEGCRCDPDRLLENDRCLLLEDCGCTYMNSYLSVGTSVLDPLCQQTITCPPNNNGNIAIDPFTCPQDGVCIVNAFRQVCQCSQNDILFNGICFDNPCLTNPCNSGRCVIDDLSLGTFYCICTPMFTGQLCNIVSRQCSVYGDPNFLTFDSESFEFRADDCEYFLVENTAFAANGASISITTEPSAVLVPELTRVNRVIIREASSVIEFLITNDAITILVDSLLVIQPTTMTVSSIGQIYNGGPDSSVTFVSSNLGYKVRVSTESGVDVKYPPNANILDGLCGDADGLATLSNAAQTTINTFGETHRVPGSCGVPLANPPANTCPPQSDEGLCSIIRSTNTASTLANCFNTVNSVPYYSNCLKDLCTSNDPNKICAVVASYAQQCRDFGITIGNWRENTNCAIMCPPNSVYDFNAPAKPPSCVTPSPPQNINPLPDVEACTCLPGFLLEGSQCIPEENCGCIFNGAYFRRNAVVFFDSCTVSCACPATGVFNPTTDCTIGGVSCHANAVCTVQNNVQACVCNSGFEGTGLDCYRPGCANSPCANGGICETRARPGQPDNPDFYCVCPAGFVGQDCSQAVGAASTGQTPLLGSSVVASPNNGAVTYLPDQLDFTQIYCPGATYVQVNIIEFITELETDILFFGAGFPEVTLQELNNITTQARAGSIGRAVPTGVEVLSGVLRNTEPLLFATDAFWFYFTSDSAYNLPGFGINVQCMSGTIPDNTVGNCLNVEGLVHTIPNGGTYILSDCETCICENGVITCVTTDPPNADAAAAPSGRIRGSACNEDADCSMLPGSTCIFPSCGGVANNCPAITNSICSSGNSLLFCSSDPLCRTVEVSLSDLLVAFINTNQVCSSFEASAAGQNLCLLFECDFIPPTSGKRAADSVHVLEIRIGARSHLRSNKELEEDIKKFEELLPQFSAEIMAKYDFVTSVELVGSEREYPEARPTVPEILVVETNYGDNNDSTPWTYMLTTLAVILLVISIGLTITIYKYYKKQTNSLNAKFNPASPSYPADNLPESLQMVNTKTRESDSIFARRIPLDDSTGNRDNVFSLSWTREEEKKPEVAKTTQSNC